MTLLTWVGILVCLVHSGMFSGLNLAFFAIDRLELEIEAKKGVAAAQRVLALRRDGNFLLVTILWGNVAINVLLALLSGSVMAGVAAFLFSTVVITIFGEVIPQAWFSRHALRAAARLAPVIRLYQLALYPVAKPTALVLDLWLGKEGVRYLPEHDLKHLLRLHMAASDSDIGHVEGTGAINFLTLDDEPLAWEGESIDPASVIHLPFEGDRPVFPAIAAGADDPFLRQVHSSGRRWVVLVDEADEPRRVLDADEFIREALFAPERFRPLRHCHRPIVVRSGEVRLGRILSQLCVGRARQEDDRLDRDIVLLWGDDRRVVTGADILGRLLRGIGAAPAVG